MDGNSCSKTNNSPMELQCLAAKSVCIWLVHEWADGDEIPVIDVWKKAHGYNTCPDHDWFLWQLHEMQVPRFANKILPNKIRYQIDDTLAPILKQVVMWIQYHHYRNFFHERQQSSLLSEYVVKLVWNHHFKIDYVATAKNILTNEKLSPLERFRFASTYCIVEEMEKFRDLMATDSLPEWNFKEEPSMVYWSKYLRNELDTISMPGVTGEFSVDTVMFNATVSSLMSELWPPVVYFFDKLDSASKSSKFKRVVELYSKRHLKDLLAKLTDREWNLACRSAISKLVEQIVEWGALDNDVRYIWKLFGNKIDSKNFCSILETLVPVSMSNASNFEKYTTLLMEIWASASSELKQSAIVDTKLWQSIGSKYIIRMDRETSDFRARRQISDPMKFIRLVLKSTNNTQKRIEFFGKNFCWLIVLAPFAEVDKLMRDFLECHQRDNIEMKKEIANSDEIDECLWTLLRFGEFDDFDAAISFYFPGVGGFVEDDDVMRYKWALMSNARGLNMLSSCLYFADWRALYDYVKKINSQTRRIAPDEFMISLIEQDHYPAVFDLTVKLCQGEMKDVREFVNAILSPTDDRLERLKKRFKDHMGKNLFSDFWLIERVERVFNRADVQDFMLWIYNGDDELIDGIYKKPVFQFLPSGFLVQLKFCFTDNCFHATKSMEEFLEWCFATEAERRQFKLDMIHKYREYKTIEDLLTARRYRRSALFWFFDGDLSAIEKFTADCARNPMNSYVAIMGN